MQWNGERFTPTIENRRRRPRFTGRALVAVPRWAEKRSISSIVDLVESRVRSLGFDGDFSERVDLFPEFGIAFLPLPAGLLTDIVLASSELHGLIVDRERYIYASPAVVSAACTPPANPLREMFVAKQGGTRITVAILDTGYDPDHPDFEKRKIIPSDHTGSGSDEDEDGHGTHCIGLACGPLDPTDKSARYGIAWDTTIVSARVLVDRLDPTDDSTIMEGIRAAQKAGAQIISMSLGSPVEIDEQYNVAFELLARQMLDDGILLIAAAGNDDAGLRSPIDHPANCPSVMAVGALDHVYQPWDHSCIGRNDCQDVDIVAPGECIRSSIIGGGYETLSGTSMATAYVAGIAALWAEFASSNRGWELRNALLSNAAPVALASGGTATDIEVGAGLVQGPPP